MDTEYLNQIIRSRKAIAALGVSFGALAGAFAGATVAAKKLKAEYEAISEQEIADAKEFYKRLYKADEFATPESAAEALLGDAQAGVDASHVRIKEAADAMIMYGNVEPAEGTHEIGKNIFTDVDVDEAFDPAAQERDPAFPYIITYEEFREGAEDYNQVTLTYYEVDGVLTDDRDDVVENEDDMVGEENLTKFGVGSQDHSIVYVRNERLELDMCIEKSRNSYATHVAGLSLEHSDGPRIRRFRTYDD